MKRLFLNLLAAGTLCCPMLPVAHAQQGPFQATPQRPSFTTDTSTTAPGTFELETGGAIVNNSSRSIPTSFKFTPGVQNGFFHGLEFSMTTDLITSAVGGDGRRETQFGDRLDFIARRRVYGSGGFSVALAPTAAFFLRDEAGAKLGLLGAAVYNRGLSSLVGNVQWRAATHPSDTNAAHTFDVFFDYSLTVGAAGTANRFAVFAGFAWTQESAKDACFSLEQGLVFSLRPDWVLDIALQQVDLIDGQRDLQVLFGFTVNMGKPGRW